MIRLNSRGAVNGLLVSLVSVTLLFLMTLGFAFWAFAGRADYKNNVDKKIATAVAIAKKTTASEKDNEFVEKEKSPLKTYTGPEAYGSLSVQYPKTWSAVITEASATTGAGTPIEAYFYPDFVPGASLTPQSTLSFAMRLQVQPNLYAAVLKNFDAGVATGKLTSKPYSAPKVPDVVGVRLDGEFPSGKTGAMVILPLRDKTILISTEANQFLNDFNTSILPSLNFVP